MNFQKIVLTIATVLLIISLIVFGSMLYSEAKVYPPTQAQCPDYWIDMSGGIGTGGYCIPLSSKYVKNVDKKRIRKS